MARLPINPDGVRIRNPRRFDQIDQMLTQQTGKTRQERMDEMFPVRGVRHLKQPYKEDYGIMEPIVDPVSGHTIHGGVNPPQFFVVRKDGTEWSDMLNSYQKYYATSPNSVPSRLDLGKNLEVDVEGEPFDSIKFNNLPPGIAEGIINQYGNPYGTTYTDIVVEEARKRGYDSVTFRNVKDSFEGNHEPGAPTADVVAMINRSLIRSESALANPRAKARKRNDILASIGAGTAGLGLGASTLEEEE